MPSPAETQPLREGRSTVGQPFVLAHITIIARIWGAVTVAAMWAAGVTTIHDNEDDEKDGHATFYYVGWYLIAASIIVTFLEATWIFDKSKCCRTDGVCCLCWRIVMWIDNWKKGILYILLSVPFFIEGSRIILGIVCGFLLIICAVLYLVKTFEHDSSPTTVSEIRYIETPPVSIETITIGTQTEHDEKYYADIFENLK